MAQIRRLDFYVARTFLGPFVLCCVGFVGLYVVIDFFTHIDDFLARGSILVSLRLAIKYYVLRIPSFISQVMPVLTVMPAVICIIQLERSNEVCAMRSSGISARRIAGPLLGCGTVVMVLAALNQELLVPALHGPMIQSEREAREGGKSRVGLAYVTDRAGRFLLIGAYDPAAPLPTLTDISITWLDKFGVVHEKKAARAVAAQVGPNWHMPTWYMEGVSEFAGRRTLLRNKEWTPLAPEPFTSPGVAKLLAEYRKAAEREGQPLIARDEQPVPISYEFGSYTERDGCWAVARDIEVIHPSSPERGRLRIDFMVWIGEQWRVFGAWRFGVIDPRTGKLEEESLPDGSVFGDSIRPDDIRAGEFKQASAMMTLGELADVGSRFPSTRFRLRCWVIIWNRLAFPLANVVLLFLALPLVFRQTARATLLGICLAVLVSLLFMVANFVSIDLAYRQWSVWKWPPLAGTFPLLLFAAVGVWLFTKMDEV